MTMYSNVATPFGRGFTYHRGEVPAEAQWAQSAQIEGVEAEFADLAPRTEAGAMLTRRSARPQKAVAVRNASAISLKPGRACVWKTGYRNRRVAGYQHAQFGEIAGFVDEHLPAAGVGAGDVFWLIRGGQVYAITDGTATTITAGDKLVAAAGTSAENDDAGRVEAVTSSGEAEDATFDETLHVAAVAIGAKASTAVNSQILIDVTLD